MDTENLINDLGYSEKMYIPESILMGWFNLSAIITATSLIFYNLARKGAIKFDPFISKGISIGLILMSTFYMLYSLLPYHERMTYLANKCGKLKKCPDIQIEHINRIKNSYIISGGIMCIIQFFISYLIIITV
jgi:O-antigen ligase